MTDNQNHGDDRCFFCSCESATMQLADGVTHYECGVCGHIEILHTCGGHIEYHEWPAIDPQTGEHLGDYKIFECKKCGMKVDIS